MTAEFDDYKYQQARDWLEHVRTLGADVATAKALVDEERKSLDMLQGIDYSASPSGSGDHDEELLNAIERTRQSIANFAAKQQAYMEERADAYRRLEMLDDATERQALTLRYLLGKSWEEACVEMAYTYDGMMTLRKRAIIHAYDVMPNDKRDPRHRAI